MKEGDQFTIIHLGLLNQNKNKVFSTGLVHNEKNEMLDMYEVFKEFQGKKIIFDGKGPFIDENGHIHAPFKAKTGAPQELTLNPVFCNISVQGLTKNTKIQKAINEEALSNISSQLSNLDEEQRKLWDKIKAQLTSGKSNYQLAEDLAFAILKSGKSLSMGCFGAKDRTGFVGARTIQRFLGEHLVKKCQGKKDGEKIIKFFSNKILDADAMAAQLVKENTNNTILKCSPFFLPGISMPKRMHYYALQLKSMFGGGL